MIWSKIGNDNGHGGPDALAVWGPEVPGHLFKKWNIGPDSISHFHHRSDTSAKTLCSYVVFYHQAYIFITGFLNSPRERFFM